MGDQENENAEWERTWARWERRAAVAGAVVVAEPCCTLAVVRGGNDALTELRKTEISKEYQLTGVLRSLRHSCVSRTKP